MIEKSNSVGIERGVDMGMYLECCKWYGIDVFGKWFKSTEYLISAFDFSLSRSFAG